MLKRVALIGSALAMAASPAHAQLPVSALPDIFESYNDCFSATESGVMNTAALVQKGWTRGTVNGPDGKPAEGGPIVYGHGERAPLIILSTTQGKGLCMVNARIASLAVFEEFKGAFNGQLPAADENGVITILVRGQPVRIAATGNSSDRRLVLVVATKPEAK